MVADLALYLFLGEFLLSWSNYIRTKQLEHQKEVLTVLADLVYCAERENVQESCNPGFLPGLDFPGRFVDQERIGIADQELEGKLDNVVLQHAHDQGHHREEGVVLLVSVAAVGLLQVRELHCVEHMGVCDAADPVVFLFEVLKLVRGRRLTR